VQEFQALYPDVQVQLMLDNEELDVNMRQADCAIRLRQPLAARPDPAAPVHGAFPRLRLADLSGAAR
jgi:DNA-binding transcriptional LysR family regulator